MRPYGLTKTGFGACKVVSECRQYAINTDGIYLGGVFNE